MGTRRHICKRGGRARCAHDNPRMAKLQLSVAVGDYDRTRPLIDGAVQIDGVDPVFMTLVPEEIFFRAFRAAEFDICEVSLSSYTVKTAAGNCPYIAVPAFVSRAFRHTSVYVRTDRVKKPQDLKGRKVGVPEYQLTANIWVRLFLEEDYGVRPSDITWVRGGYEHPGRIEKISLNLPANDGTPSPVRCVERRRNTGTSNHAESDRGLKQNRIGIDKTAAKTAVNTDVKAGPTENRWWRLDGDRLGRESRVRERQGASECQKGAAYHVPPP